MTTTAPTPTEPLTTRQARAELTRLVEPPDTVATALIATIGPIATYELATSHATPDQTTIDAVTTSEHPQITRDRLLACLDRLRLRYLTTDGPVRLDVMASMGIGLLTPEDPQWPQALAGPQTAPPIALWWYAKGTDDPRQRFPALPQTLTVTGTRQLSDYGATVTADLTTELLESGLTIMAPSAYGTGSASLRAALAAENPHGVTAAVAVLPSGPDRLHPAGASSLLSDVAETGLVLSEYGPGSAATRLRQMRSNALLAHLSAGVVVVEGTGHSSANATVDAAAELGVPLAAVPGSIYSPTSQLPNALLSSPEVTSATDARAVSRILT